MKYRYLSHHISEGMPVCGGKAKISIETMRAIAQGDSSNAYKFSMESHWGTHVDTPRHFFDKGNSIEDYPSCTWFFKSPEVINIFLKPSEVLNMGKWIDRVNLASDILLFRSGWSNLRKDEKYIAKNPGIHPEVGIYLRKRYRNLRAIGIDWISISSGKNKPLGREAHRAFLDPRGRGKPLLIVEDMYLPANLSGLQSIIVSPLVVSGIDSAPCTVLGVFND
jgi:kynurenine formamidase